MSEVNEQSPQRYSEGLPGFSLNGMPKSSADKSDRSPGGQIDTPQGHVDSSTSRDHHDQELQEDMVASSTTSTTDDGLSREKSNAGANVGEGADANIAQQPSKGRPWKTTIIRLGPLAGLCGMMLAMASIFASLGILLGSDGQSVAGWNVQPAAYLAICTAIANQSMRFAAWQGVAIAWWTRASRKRSTLAQLHHDWRSGTTLFGALTAGRHLSWLGLACIFSTLVAIDGPLLQRASTVVSAPIVNQPVTLHVQMYPEIPTEFTGVWFPSRQPDQFWNATIPTSNGAMPNYIGTAVNSDYMAWTVGAWSAEAPMEGFIQGCPPNHKCGAKISAPAVALQSCKSYTIPVDYSEPNVVEIRQALTNPTYVYPLSTNAFLIDLRLRLDDQERMNLITGYSTTQDCVGTYNYTACTLESAIGEYEVSVEDGIVSLISGPQILAIANNTKTNYDVDQTQAGRSSTLGGVTDGFMSHWFVQTVIFPYKGDLSITGYNGGLSSEYSLPSTVVKDPSQCPSWKDPQPDVLSNLNRLMFYTGIYASRNDNPSLRGRLDEGVQTQVDITGEIIGQHNIYQSNFHWFIGATLLEVVCIAFVLPTYWGWWKLGRKVSLSPVEVAKAFEAPALSSLNSNSSARDIARELGSTPLQYGATTDSGKTKIALADPASVEPPQKSSRFDV